MHITSQYLIHPGHCLTCGSSTPGKIIDCDSDHHGHVRRFHVYLCEACVLAAYKMLEPSKVLIETVDLARKEGEITSLTTEVLKLRAEQEAWDRRLAALVKDGADA